jgi:hypothetical protein
VLLLGHDLLFDDQAAQEAQVGVLSHLCRHLGEQLVSGELCLVSCGGLLHRGRPSMGAMGAVAGQLLLLLLSQQLLLSTGWGERRKQGGPGSAEGLHGGHDCSRERLQRSAVAKPGWAGTRAGQEGEHEASRDQLRSLGTSRFRAVRPAHGQHAV